MNDFTKEELDHMREGLCVWIGEINFYPSEIPILIEKIQSMIENYQEDIPSHALCRKCMKIVHE